MPESYAEKIKQAADYVRYLSVESIEKAHSGHPGLPLGCAEIAVTLYRDILNIIPGDPLWLNRDRFVLSAGHGSILLYAVLHLSGYDLSLSDLDSFRQLGSRTPGHPEMEKALGVETTTGPLGQGIANSVGLAIEAKMLGQRFNRPDFNLFDYGIYCLAGDGCQMEGISYESASLAGHLGLDNLTLIYDSNQITIDGRTDITFSEDVGRRYEAMGWYVDRWVGASIDAFREKMFDLKRRKYKPKLLICQTVIGQGLKEKRDTAGIHGAPAGPAEIAYLVSQSSVRDLFIDHYGSDMVDNPDELQALITQRIDGGENLLDSPLVREFIQSGLKVRKKTHEQWHYMLNRYRQKHPDKAQAYDEFFSPLISASLRKKLNEYREEKADSIRNISGRLLNICAAEVPQLVGGSADLAGSTKSTISSSSYLSRGDFSGNNLAFGVREHAMGAVANGLALNGVLRPFTSTFLIFCDYMKPSIRLAALMKLKHLFNFSHDSIHVGEDGPTHQPIEQLNSLRTIPDLYTFRPSNDIESAYAYRFYLEGSGPVAIVTTRQKVEGSLFSPDIRRKYSYEQFETGAIIIYENNPSSDPDFVLAASGSEVGLALLCAKRIHSVFKKDVRVISIPCLELFNEADPGLVRGLLSRGKSQLIFIEAASHRAVSLFYDRDTLLIDIQSFGVTAPGQRAAEHFGFQEEMVFDKVTAHFNLTT